jgi:hypothetical protein
MILGKAGHFIAADRRLNVPLHSEPAGLHLHLLAAQVTILHLKQQEIHN